MELPTLNNLCYALLISIGILLLIQLIYHLIIYVGIIKNHKRAIKGKISYTTEHEPLSVIIYHNGDAEELQENLPAILEQDYPSFEVILITDEKIGESVDYLKRIESQYPCLYHSYLPSSSKWISRKKLALSLGIRASKHEWLVFTDSYCKPDTNQWLNMLSRNFTPQTQIVLGYSGFKRGDGWKMRSMGFDNFFRSLRFLCFALLRLPYMGIGRNMAYKKELFIQQKGFGKHLDLLHGYDDLFINTVSNRKNTRVETDAQACVTMNPLKIQKFWKEERLGYESTSRHFRGIHKHLLGFETFTRILFFLTCIASIIIGCLYMNILLIIAGAVALIIRFISLVLILNKSASIIGEKYRYYTTLPIFDILQPWMSWKWKLNYLFSDKVDFRRK